MKIKLSLVALALVATVVFASAQTTPVKEVKAEKEKSCCPEAKQKVTADKKDAKTCKCEGLKEVNGKVAQNKECTGTCDQKEQKCTANTDKKEQKCAVAGDKKAEQCAAASAIKEKECAVAGDKKEQKCAGTCEEEKVAASSCSVKDKAPVKPAKEVKK